MKTNCKIVRRIMRVILMCTICAAVLAGCGNKTDALDFVSVNFSGYNGNGEAHLSVDYDAMIGSIIGEEPADDNYEKFSKWLNEYLIYEDGIAVACTPKDGLSNGDIVKVKVSLSETVGKKLVGGEKKFTVTGLPEIETVDIFQDIVLRYEGVVGGNSVVHLDKLSDNTVLQECHFQIEPQTNIKNGDTVTITITNAESLTEKYLCVPAEITKTFIVEGLDEYLTDPDLLPEDKIQEIIAQYVSSSHAEDNFIFTHSEPAYYKTYFGVGKEGVIGTDVNQLLIYVCYDQYMDGAYRWTVYKPLIFRNLILQADGTVELDFKDGENAVFQTSAEAVEEYMEDLYIVEEVYVEY